MRTCLPKGKRLPFAEPGGTHKGEYMGIARTGKETTISGIEIPPIMGGKIAEEWSESGWLGFLQQPGAKVGQE